MYLLFQKQRLETLKDVSIAEAGKWGTHNEYAFFDKVLYNKTCTQLKTSQMSQSVGQLQ